jgi:hypothetical protein
VSPPAITVSWPFSALAAPPESGASTHATWQRSRNSCASCRVEAGSIDDMSISTPGGAIVSATPPGPSATVRTMSTVFTQVMTKSQPRAASAAQSLARAPWATRGRSFSGLRV